MLLKQLYKLNGSKRGEFKKHIDQYTAEPRITWYPSAGQDFRALKYLHSNYAAIHPATQLEPPMPDIFLFTDYFPWEWSNFLDTTNIYSDLHTRITIDYIEALPSLDYKLHKELVDFGEASRATNKVVFLTVNVESDKLGIIFFPVIYAFAENESFYCKALVPSEAIITHLIHIRYGCGLGGGGKATGIWLLNVLKQLECELLITDNHYSWQSGDLFALKYCASIPAESNAQLLTIRILNSNSWSGHGDDEWQLIK